MVIAVEPQHPIPTAFRPPRRPLHLGVTSHDLAHCPELTVAADNEGWPVGIENADSLAARLLAARCTFASGSVEALWKLLPPHVGAALAQLPPGQMVQNGDTWWGSLSNGSLVVRKGRNYGHLCQMDRSLVVALAGAGFSDIGFPNSPGAVASCILMNHAPLPNLYRGEIPRDVLQIAHQCDKGGRMEALQLGTFPYIYCYDFTSAYAAILADLPDAGHCTWVQTPDYCQDATYGFLRARLVVPQELPASPVAYRAILTDKQKDLEGLRFVTGEQEVCIIKPEYDLAIEQGCKGQILDAWWGYSENGDRPFSALMHKLFLLRRKNPALSGQIKLLMNAMIGQMSSAHGSWDSVGQQTSESVSPCWNSVYASYVRGLQRVKLFRSVQDWETLASLTIDGLITTRPMTLSPSLGLGGLRLDGEGPATILTDYAKDRPGHAPLWRQAALVHSTERTFTLPLTYRAGLSAYNHWPLAEAHRQIGRMVELNTPFPIGSVTRRSPAGVTVADLLREAIPTHSMGIRDLC